MVVRSDWTQSQVQALFDLPFYTLFDQARSLHKTFFPNQDVQLATLLSIKTGGCPEDCGYCPQSAHHKQVALKSDPLMDVATVRQAAQAAKAKGASRFCMGAAWRSPNTHTEKDRPSLTPFWT